MERQHGFSRTKMDNGHVNQSAGACQEGMMGPFLRRFLYSQ